VFNITRLQKNVLTLHSEIVNIITKTLSTNFETGQYISAYMSMFSGIGKENRDEENEVELILESDTEFIVSI
jgi:hypothetical protein